MIKKIFIILFILSPRLWAKNIEYHGITYTLPGFVVDEEEGYFIDFTKRLFGDLNLKTKLSIFPPKRAMYLFSQDKFDFIFPYIKRHGLKNLIYSDEFFIKEEVLFYKKNKLFLGQNSKICLTRGYSYSQKSFKKYKDFYYAQSDKACFLMLRHDRVDGVISERVTGILTLKNLNSENIVFDKVPISSDAVHYAFHNNERGRELQKLINQQLKIIKKTNWYKNLFPYYEL